MSKVLFLVMTSSRCSPRLPVRGAQSMIVVKSSSSCWGPVWIKKSHCQNPWSRSINNNDNNNKKNDTNNNNTDTTVQSRPIRRIQHNSTQHQCAIVLSMDMIFPPCIEHRYIGCFSEQRRKNSSFSSIFLSCNNNNSSVQLQRVESLTSTSNGHDVVPAIKVDPISPLATYATNDTASTASTASTVSTASIATTATSATTIGTSATTTTSGSCTSSAPLAVDYGQDYLTNDGIIEGVWMFTRHGDRTPSKSLSPEHRRYEEGEYWITALPKPSMNDVYARFSTRFPLMVHAPKQLPLNDNIIIQPHQYQYQQQHQQYNNLSPPVTTISKTVGRFNSSPTSNTTSTTGLYSSISDPAYVIADRHKGTFIDSKRYPFGYLTDIGIQQLCENGRRFFNRYNRHGYHFPNQNDWRWTHAQQDFMSVWDIQAYSTNYLRTVMSVQSFLDGMLGTNLYNSNNNNTTKSNITNTTTSTTIVSTSFTNLNKTTPIDSQQQQQQQQHQQQNNEQTQHAKENKGLNASSEAISTSTPAATGTTGTDIPKSHNDIRVPDHTWPSRALIAGPSNGNVSIGGGVRSDGDNQLDYLVPIQVRETTSDPLNAFDRNPELIAELVSEVMLSEYFLQRDGSAAPLAARLANILPGLVRHKHKRNISSSSSCKSTTSTGDGKTSDFASKTPSGINWVEAADHFVCRAAHGVNLARFSDYEHDEHVEQTLQAMSYQTMAHLSWRFRQWYQHRRLLSVIAAPPLREIVNQMKNIPDLGVHDQHPFVVYSCHDITILGLLYGIGAEFLAIDDSGEWRYWPPYGSCLVFELVRITKATNTTTMVNDNQTGTSSVSRSPVSSSSHVVRVLLNGKPILTVDMIETNERKVPCYNGSGPQRMLTITDLDDIISKLEKEGVLG